MKKTLPLIVLSGLILSLSLSSCGANTDEPEVAESTMNEEIEVNSEETSETTTPSKEVPTE